MLPFDEYSPLDLALRQASRRVAAYDAEREQALARIVRALLDASCTRPSRYEEHLFPRVQQEVQRL